jgi:hypothetical protein
MLHHTIDGSFLLAKDQKNMARDSVKKTAVRNPRIAKRKRRVMNNA